MSDNDIYIELLVVSKAMPSKYAQPKALFPGRGSTPPSNRLNEELRKKSFVAELKIDKGTLAVVYKRQRMTTKAVSQPHSAWRYDGKTLRGPTHI